MTNTQREALRLLETGLSIAEICRRKGWARSTVTRARGHPQAREYVASLRLRALEKVIGSTPDEILRQHLLEAVADGDTERADLLRLKLAARDFSQNREPGPTAASTENGRGINAAGELDSPWYLRKVSKACDWTSEVPPTPEQVQELDRLNDLPRTDRFWRIVKAAGEDKLRSATAQLALGLDEDRDELVLVLGLS